MLGGSLQSYCGFKTYIELKQLYEQHAEGEIDALIADEQFNGAYREVAGGINDGYRLYVSTLRKILAVLTGYAEGNFSVSLERLPGKLAQANEGVELLRQNLQNVIDETVTIAGLTAAGALGVRGDADGYTATLNALLPVLTRPGRHHRSHQRSCPSSVSDSGRRSAGQYDR